MKRLLLILVLALMLAGCRKTTDKQCASNWRDLISGIDRSILTTGEIAGMILQQKMLPDTIGEYAQQCLEEGYRPPGL